MLPPSTSSIYIEFISYSKHIKSETKGKDVVKINFNILHKYSGLRRFSKVHLNGSSREIVMSNISDTALRVKSTKLLYRTFTDDLPIYSSRNLTKCAT
jgi:hypothetical protein